MPHSDYELHKQLERIHNELREIRAHQEKIMSAVTEWAAQEQANLDTISTTLDGIVAGVAALDLLITNFQNSPGTLSATDQAALDAIQASSKNLVQKATAIVVTPPVPPAV